MELLHQETVWIYDGSSCKKCSQAMHNKGTVCSSGSPSLSDKQRRKRDGD